MAVLASTGNLPDGGGLCLQRNIHRRASSQVVSPQHPHILQGQMELVSMSGS